jgi:hypothetical protein
MSAASKACQQQVEHVSSKCLMAKALFAQQRVQLLLEREHVLRFLQFARCIRLARLQVLILLALLVQKYKYGR